MIFPSVFKIMATLNLLSKTDLWEFGIKRNKRNKSLIALPGKGGSSTPRPSKPGGPPGGWDCWWGVGFRGKYRI